ncbi:MAG: hypothetical protein GXP27_12455 [Planctomycetes bacterium]|nr:hypothetical protein [Planctomycetota bacterium]
MKDTGQGRRVALAPPIAAIVACLALGLLPGKTDAETDGGGKTVSHRHQPAAVSESMQRLIRQAGNADEESERLEALMRLQRVPGLEASLKSDVDKMVAFVRRWNDTRRLAWFSREVSRTCDFDFGIDHDSPLYPMTCLYRGRMLVWMTLESGNILHDPKRRRMFLDKAVANFQQAQKAFPKNRIIGMYLGKPVPWEKSLTPAESAPEWAVLIRENLERMTDIIVWWIDHRMQPDGQYGGGWGDDCEMWRWWVPVLIGFDDPKIVAAQAKFSRALLSQPHMKGGYTSVLTDVEHSAEDSSDVITPMMHLEPDSPEWKGRADRLAQLMRDLWTGVNQRGFLQFKSTYFSVDRVDRQPERACDTVYHPRAVQPALLLWQRTGDRELGKLFARWMDTWVDAAARAERGKPAGVVPSAIHWPDGRVGGLGPEWWDPRNHGEPTLYQWPSALSMLNDTLLLTWFMTADEKYLRPLRSMAAIRLRYLKDRPAGSPRPGSEAWCAARLGLLASTLAKYRSLTGRTEFDELLQREGYPVGDLSPDQRMEKLMPRLRASSAALRVNFAGYTSEVRWTDRVLRFPALFAPGMMFPKGVPGFETPNPSLIYSIVTGDPGRCGYFPLNAVRWLTSPRNIAAWVTEARADRFAARLFLWDEGPRSMAAELYLLRPGRYSLTLAIDAPGQRPRIVSRQQIEVTGRRTLQVPSRQVVSLRAVPLP